MAKKPSPNQQIKDLERQLATANDALEISLALSPVTDNNFFPNGMSGSYNDRNSWDRKKIFSEALRAWRVNPMARRIVRLMRSFIIGKGLTIKSNDEAIQTYLQEWWSDPLNKFKKNIKRWVDENTRTGNLFFLYTVQENGNTHVRAVAAETIEEIITADNDIEQEIKYEKASDIGTYWEAYDPLKTYAGGDSFMLHFAVNQPVGSPWGEGDLPPLLVWIGRFATWLEDRVRLNHFRAVFMYVVQGNYPSTDAKLKRQKEINANPPKAGTVLVTDPSEQWGIMSANLDSFDASVDGMAIKKMILDGIGQPLHWHAEPEDGMSTTAEAAGTPTFRTLEETQGELFEMLTEMAQVAAKIKFGTIKANIWIEGSDITERDNATLALALGRAYPNIADMFDREAIDAKEFMRLTYKMFAEIWDETKIPNIKKKPLVKPADQASTIADPATDPTDPASREIKE